jgi:transcriptional antiterminator RfaH
MAAEKLHQGKWSIVDQALFPRYLFIRLGQEPSAASWSPIRSTWGVSKLVSFGEVPAKVDDQLIQFLLNQQAFPQIELKRLFKPGESVLMTKAPFAGVEGIYQMTNADQRVMVLIEFMSKTVRVRLPLSALKKVG